MKKISKISLTILAVVLILAFTTTAFAAGSYNYSGITSGSFIGNGYPGDKNYTDANTYCKAYNQSGPWTYYSSRALGDGTQLSYVSLNQGESYTGFLRRAYNSVYNQFINPGVYSSIYVYGNWVVRDY
jgi:hypothetical protein